MSEPKRPSLSTGVFYKDPKAALKWLEDAFGFEPVMVVVNADGTIGHSEMRFGDGLIYVGHEWDEHHKSPASLGGKNTQSINVRLDQSMDEHCERARAAGAVITREPVDQFYGDRSYVAVDPEGHIWSFSQTIQVMTLEEVAAAGGGDVRTRL
jgi:uncharacterized glyoxalase superfamily protein PhnB